MMLVQVSVTMGEVGMETIGTLSIHNVGSADPYDKYEFMARWRDEDGAAHVKEGVTLHLPGDGAFALVRNCIEEVLR